LNEGCSELLDQRKEAKLNNVRCKANKHIRNKKREYVKEEINEIAMNSKIKNIRNLYRGIHPFKRDYQHRSYLVKDENGDLLQIRTSFEIDGRRSFSQLLNVHGVSDVRKT
jgi:hypothetical protein